VAVWYFFMAVGTLAIACVFFFFAFETWDSGRRDASRVPKPKRVALELVTGLAFVGLTLWLLSLRGT
jgi:hypothetical protein